MKKLGWISFSSYPDEWAYRIAMGFIGLGILFAFLLCAGACAGVFWLIGALYV